MIFFRKNCKKRYVFTLLSKVHSKMFFTKMHVSTYLICEGTLNCLTCNFHVLSKPSFLFNRKFHIPPEFVIGITEWWVLHLTLPQKLVGPYFLKSPKKWWGSCPQAQPIPPILKTYIFFKSYTVISNEQQRCCSESEKTGSLSWPLGLRS